MITAPPLGLPLAAELDDELVGTVDLHGTGTAQRELGYTVGPSCRWGRGLGTAIAAAGLEHGFAVLGLESVWAESLPPNVASVRILERLGMRSSGEGGTAAFLGAPARYRQYRITRAAWLARQA